MSSNQSVILLLCIRMAWVLSCPAIFCALHLVSQICCWTGTFHLADNHPPETNLLCQTFLTMSDSQQLKETVLFCGQAPKLTLTQCDCWHSVVF